jgi:hypothetical protein
MPLQKQNVPLSLNQGMNTQFDPKQQPFGSFVSVENVTFDKEGEFNKREGYENLKSDNIGLTSVQEPISVSKFKEQPLWISRDQVYSYSEAAERWHAEGSYDSCNPESNPIVQNGVEQRNVQVAVMDKYNFYAYVTGVDTVKLTVQDQETEAYLVYDTTIASGTKIRVATFDNFFYIFYVDNSSNVLSYNRLLFDKFISGGTDTLTFAGASTVATLKFNGTDGNAMYDVAAGFNNLFIAYHDDSANKMLFGKVSKTFTKTVGLDPFTSGTETYKPKFAIDLLESPNRTFVVTFADENNKIKIGSVTEDGLTNRAVAVVEDLSTSTEVTSISNITSNTLDGLTYEVFYQYYQENPFIYTISTGARAASTVNTDRYTWNQYVLRSRDWNIKTGTSTTAAGENIARGVGLASKAFVVDTNIYVTAIRETELNSCYYVMKTDGSIQAKVAQGVAGPLLNSVRKRANGSTWSYHDSSGEGDYRIGSLTAVPSITSEKFLLGSNIQGKIVGGATGTTSYFTLYGVNSTVLDFDNVIANETAVIGENLNFAGGQPKAYDGNVLVEQNFNFGPESLIITQATTGGAVNDGVHLYYAIYTWTDAQGNVHRSGLSLQGSDNSTSTSGTNVNTIKIPTLTLTQKSDVYIELYRTVAGGTVFYRCMANNELTKSQTFSPIENQPLSDFVSFVDKAADATIENQELLYTTGGVLENISPPSCSIVGSYKNRLFLAGLENKLEIKYSKLTTEKDGVGFNDSLFFLTPETGGDIIALKGMDDKLIIFKKNAIFFIAGDGPNNLGQQDTFTEPQLVSADVGCSVRSSVVLTPQGLFFKSNKGIYLLSRSLGLEYIGAPVEDYNDLTITKADMVPSENQVRFLTSDGPCLVYNYYRRFWSLYTSHKGQGSVVIGDSYYYINSDGASSRLYKQKSNHYLDDHTPINMALETGWMNPIAAQNVIRVYRMLILGEYFSPHKLKISVAYDYNNDFVESSVVDVTSYTEVYEYGDPGSSVSSTGVSKLGYYGDPGGTTGSYTTAIAYGGKDVMQYQIRINFKKQKCESIKIKIETLQQAGQNGKGVNLSQLLFVAGSKAKDFKLKQSRTFKTT